MSLGIRQGGELVAWIMTHDDGAMGFLNVLKDFRRKGHAMELLAAMSSRLRVEGKLPFAHIEEDNCKSMNLALKLGFQKYGRVNWVKLRKAE